MASAFPRGSGTLRAPATACLVLLLLVVPRVAGAEEVGGVDAARTHFLRGVELYQDGDFEAALADFERAYELAPHWGLLYNIGRVRAELHRYAEALEALEQYLEEGGGDVPPDRRAEVRREIRRLRSLVAEIVIVVARPSSAVILVDGTEVGRAPLDAPLLVSAGRRIIEVRAPGFMPFRRDVTVAGGGRSRIEVSLEAAATTTGSIYVSSTVPAVVVSVDGEEVGQAPLDEPVVATPGRHVVEATRLGYEPAGRMVEVTAGQLETIELRPTPQPDLPRDLAARLRVEVNEDDADVTVDGEHFEGQPLPMGPHVVEVRRAGFHEWSGEVDLEVGEERTLDVVLLPTEAFLERYERRARAWQIGAWVTVGVGVALVATFAGLYSWLTERFADWEADRARLDWEWMRLDGDPRIRGTRGSIVFEEDYAESDRVNDGIVVEEYVYIGGIITGCAAVVTGIILAFVGPSPWRYSRVAFAPRLDGFALAAAF